MYKGIKCSVYGYLHHAIFMYRQYISKEINLYLKKLEGMNNTWIYCQKRKNILFVNWKLYLSKLYLNKTVLKQILKYWKYNTRKWNNREMLFIWYPRLVFKNLINLYWTRIRYFCFSFRYFGICIEFPIASYIIYKL